MKGLSMTTTRCRATKRLPCTFHNPNAGQVEALCISMQAARSEFASQPDSFTAFAAMRRAEAAYYATPEGFAILEEQIDSDEYQAHRSVLVEVRDTAVKLRREHEYQEQLQEAHDTAQYAPSIAPAQRSAAVVLEAFQTEVAPGKFRIGSVESKGVEFHWDSNSGRISAVSGGDDIETMRYEALGTAHSSVQAGTMCRDWWKASRGRY